MSKQNLNEKIYLSEGNKKLRNDEKNRFLIWNLPAEITCPNATEECKRLCYAKKAERLYPATSICRQRSLDESMNETFVDDMTGHISYHLGRKLFSGKEVWFRIHESGDFYNLKYLKKWIAISSRFPQVHFTAYTKSVKLVEKIIDEIPSNFVIRYSVWDDTKSEDLVLAEKLELPIYYSELEIYKKTDYLNQIYELKSERVRYQTVSF